MQCFGVQCRTWHQADMFDYKQVKFWHLTFKYERHVGKLKIHICKVTIITLMEWMPITKKSLWEPGTKKDYLHSPPGLNFVWLFPKLKFFLSIRFIDSNKDENFFNFHLAKLNKCSSIAHIETFRCSVT